MPQIIAGDKLDPKRCQFSDFSAYVAGIDDRLTKIHYNYEKMDKDLGRIKENMQDNMGDMEHNLKV